MTFIDIIKIIGACAAIIGTGYSIWNSKRSILRRIDRKVERIRQIDYELDLKYGLNRGTFRPLCYLDDQKEKLQNQVDELKRYL
jgi:hypothetical protein